MSFNRLFLGEGVAVITPLLKGKGKPKYLQQMYYEKE